MINLNVLSFFFSLSLKHYCYEQKEATITIELLRISILTMNLKIKLVIQMIALVLLTSSCSTSIYYQLYKTKSNDIKEEDARAISSNHDLEIKYHFWSEGGSSSFLIKNKTDKHIFINTSLSHLIVNGLAYTYYQGRVRGESTTISSTASVHNSTSWAGIVAGNNVATGIGSKVSTTKNSSVENQASVTYAEMKIISIPPNSSKIITGTGILRSDLYEHCNLEDRPKRKEKATLTFDEKNTPLHVRNYISYTTDISDSNYKVKEDIFWVSEITNYPRSSFLETQRVEECGKSTDDTQDIFIHYQPTSFYMEYIFN